MTRWAALVFCVAACGAEGPRVESTEAPPPVLVARLPEPAGRFAPSYAALTAKIQGTALADVEVCETCHADVVASWRTSAHAFASFQNPIYRVSVDRLRQERGNRASRFCGGCHDPSLLVDDALDVDVEPNDPRAVAGVTCRTCHSITHTTPDGNGSWLLDASAIPYPDAKVPGSREQHIARVAPAPLRTAAMCASCHKVFLDEGSGNARHLAGQDDATPYFGSVFAGSMASLLDDEIAPETCQTCHMPREPATQGDAAAKGGMIASHRFLGGHSWMAAMRGDPAQVARAAEFIRGVASIDVAAATAADGTRTLPADGASLAPGTRLTLEVVVRNLHVGHRFPGGTLDAHDTWIEVTARDAEGRVLAQAGMDEARTGNDLSAHKLRALLVGDDGQPLLERQTHRFRAVAWNQTLAPRDATVVAYGFDVPADVQEPVRVTARLRHRSRNLELQRAACADSKTERGKKFALAAESMGKGSDPCVAEPIDEIASAEVELGKGAAVLSARPAWRRLFDHALGLAHAVQERADEARPSLLRALDDVTRTGTPREQAMVLLALADLEGREGRPAEAGAWLDRATPLVPASLMPALARVRGTALAEVWRFADAAAPLAVAANGAPLDDSRWNALAGALGSAGDDRGSLDAAWRGLALQPRDPDLLRAQALALGHLGAPAEVVKAAMEAYLARRVDDEAPKFRGKCQRTVPGCALERNPVHVHVMAPAPAP